MTASGHMTPWEIVQDVLQARQPMQMVRILAVLNDCEKEDIIELLDIHGYRLERQRTKKGNLYKNSPCRVVKVV